MGQLRKLLKSPGLIIGALLILAALAGALLGPAIINRDPNHMAFENALLGPSSEFPFGTDVFGRDLLVRTMAGLRVSLAIAAGAIGLATLIGVLLGIIAGYTQSMWGQVLMRGLDVLLAFPPILIAIAIVAFWGTGPYKLAVAIGIVQIPRFARLAYGSTISTREFDYVQAAEALGSTKPRILMRHLLPNVLSPIIVEGSIAVGTAVLTEAGLSYLGLGTPPPLPSLGRMISEGAEFLSIAPWTLGSPAAVLSLTIIGLNMLGDALRDQFDPRAS